MSEPLPPYPQLVPNPDYSKCPACDNDFAVETTSQSWSVSCDNPRCASLKSHHPSLHVALDVAMKALTEIIEAEMGEQREKAEAKFIAENPPKPEWDDV